MFVGIDVSKEWVDVAVRPTGEAWRVTRDQDAVDGLVLRLKDLAPQLVVVEATGGYEVPLVAPLRASGVPVAVVNPRRPGLCPLPGHIGEDRPPRCRVIAKFGEVSDVEVCLPGTPGARRTPPAGHPDAYLRAITSPTGPAGRMTGIEEVIAFLDQQLKEIDETLGAGCGRVRCGESGNASDGTRDHL